MQIFIKAAFLVSLLFQTNALSIGVETEVEAETEAELDAENIKVFYDYEGTDGEYVVELESGMYGDGSEFAYKKDWEIHLDGKNKDSSSKVFYQVPDSAPQSGDVEELDPFNFNLGAMFNLKYPNGPGWLAHLISGEDASEFAEDVVHYATHMLGMEEDDYYYTPFDEFDKFDFEDM